MKEISTNINSLFMNRPMFSRNICFSGISHRGRDVIIAEATNASRRL
jgi:hypothetical protein